MESRGERRPELSVTGRMGLSPVGRLAGRDRMAGGTWGLSPRKETRQGTGCVGRWPAAVETLFGVCKGRLLGAAI